METDMDLLASIDAEFLTELSYRYMFSKPNR
jgi:hypothetical protein